MIRSTSRRAAAVVLVAALALGVAAAGADNRPARTEVVSRTAVGAVADDWSYNPTVSADGRWVAFVSHAPNLVPGNTNRGCYGVITLTGFCSDIYVLERATGGMTRVSVAADGTQGNGPSNYPSISADGRYVSFLSLATNLVPGDTNRNQDVFVHDRDTNGNGVFDEPGGIATQRVSVTSDGKQVSREIYQGVSREREFAVCSGSLCSYPTISPDGGYVAFSTTAPDLRPDARDTAARLDAYVHDRKTRRTELVSVSQAGGPANGHSFTGGTATALSEGGRYVTFTSTAANLVDGDDNNQPDVFVHDRETGGTVRVSVASDGEEAHFSPAQDGGISADGRYVTFRSTAHEYVPNDTNICVGTARAKVGESYVRQPKACVDIFVHDRDANETGVFDEAGGTAIEQVSVTSTGGEANGDSVAPAISPDGRYVTFSSWASKLALGDKPRPGEPVLDSRKHQHHAYVHDRVTGITELVSKGDDGTPANAFWTRDPSTSGDGRYTAFTSTATNIAPTGAYTGNYDLVFGRDRGPDVGVGRLDAALAPGTATLAGWATFSGAVVAAARGGEGLPAATPAGGDLTRSSVVYRPQLGDLMVRWDVADLPSVSARVVNTGVAGFGSVGGAPAVAYILQFVHAGTRFEVRATARVDRAPEFALYRCEQVCQSVGELEGAYGTTGLHVRAFLPLDVLGAQEGDALTALRAATVPVVASGAPLAWDEVALGEAVIPRRTLAVAVAPVGAAEDDVRFEDATADLAAGTFASTVDTTGLPAGDYAAWAKACLGERCGAVSAPVMPSSQDT